MIPEAQQFKIDILFNYLKVEFLLNKIIIIISI